MIYRQKIGIGLLSGSARRFVSSTVNMPVNMAVSGLYLFLSISRLFASLKTLNVQEVFVFRFFLNDSRSRYIDHINKILARFLGRWYMIRNRGYMIRNTIQINIERMVGVSVQKQNKVKPPKTAAHTND